MRWGMGLGVGAVGTRSKFPRHLNREGPVKRQSVTIPGWVPLPISPMWVRRRALRSGEHLGGWLSSLQCPGQVVPSGSCALSRCRDHLRQPRSKPAITYCGFQKGMAPIGIFILQEYETRVAAARILRRPLLLNLHTFSFLLRNIPCLILLILSVVNLFT